MPPIPSTLTSFLHRDIHGLGSAAHDGASNTESSGGLLQRQLERSFGPDFRVPETWRGFLAAVDDAYRSADAEKLGLERLLAASAQELRATGAEMRAVFRAIPDLLIRLDATGVVLDLRAGMHGDRTLEAAEREEILAAHLGETFRAAAGRTIETRQMAAFEYALTSGDATLHYEARLVPVMENQVVAFVRDITARKRAEEDLFNSREMLRKILDTIPQRVFWKDRESVYIGCNRHFAADTGFREPKEIVGQTDYDTASSDTAEVYRADDRQVMSSDRAKLGYDEPQKRSDGSHRWLRTSKVPLHDQDGHVIGLMGTYEDVTERKLTETLRAGQNRILEMIVTGAPLKDTLCKLALLMESLSADMRCSIMLVDADGAKLRTYAAPSLSGEFEKVVDGIAICDGVGSCGTAAARKEVVISPDVLQDERWKDFWWFAKQFGVGACWSAPVMSSHDSVLGTFAMYFGQPRTPAPEELQLVHIASHIAGIAIQRTRAEEALRKAEEKYRNIFENALDGIFQITPEGRVLEANPAFARMFGYETPAALIAGVRDVPQQLCLQPMRYAEFTQALQAKGLVQRWELPMRSPEQGILWISIDARLARAADGQTLCYEGIAEDVTERKRLEQQFLQSQKMEAFGQLAGGVAHDFNNLLTVILGNLSLIRLGDIPAAQAHAAIDDCFRAAQRAANLTSQLLTFSRRQPVEPKDLDLNELVANMTKMLQPLIGEHITLEATYAPGGARVRADPGMMEQALMNLALNSRDAMPKGGTLHVATAAVNLDADAAWTSLKGRPGSFVRLTVRDTGVGIAAEHLPHIFEPFFTTKEVGKGSGLGLASVEGIVHQSGGSIDVTSEPELGTTFTICLPRA